MSRQALALAVGRAGFFRVEMAPRVGPFDKPFDRPLDKPFDKFRAPSRHAQGKLLDRLGVNSVTTVETSVSPCLASPSDSFRSTGPYPPSGRRFKVDKHLGTYEEVTINAQEGICQRSLVQLQIN
jgi:hypothetical protein